MHGTLLTDDVDPRLPAAIKERLPLAQATAEANAALAGETMRGDFIKVCNVELGCIRRSEGSKKGKVIALHKLADKYCAPIAAVAACRKGCNHCCHIPVAITQSEAEAIGEAIGRAPHKLARKHRRPTHFFGYESPCPFLKSNACSIYEHRPLPCRVHFNLDKDDLLCRLDEAPGGGIPSPVPYANVVPLLRAYIEMDTGRLGDIRDYFK
jgi:hypothetical protein